MDDDGGIQYYQQVEQQHQEQLDAECGKLLSDAIWQMMVAMNRTRTEEINNG